MSAEPTQPSGTLSRIMVTSELARQRAERGALLDGNVAREVDRADQEIDAFIERRHAEREKINAQAQEWRESEQRYRQHKRDELLSAWVDYYLRLADGHEELAERAREMAWSLDG